ncbi:hypothetical protein IPA_09495 [Ignicoccus pacificus DSM 13166]|uniref:Thiamine-binding protein domain-containing protein n=1 Tax=Ignicoccus pacificus DSM 13166 TaxID=940294 RepID=A0A977PL37_9CREN|nr:hypothetical protein IPA_09495 [Ignicoccus pacificus DSM 13166]
MVPWVLLGAHAMPLVELQVLPLGTGSPSVSEYVAEAVKVIAEKSEEYKVTPMSTVFKVKDLSKACEIIKEIESKLKEKGVKRVVIMMRVDDRFDKDLDMDRKVQSVMKRLENP